MSVEADSQEFGIRYNFMAPYLDGVYLAVNAIPDAYLVYDAHDCGYYKAEKIAGHHDLFSDLLRWDRVDRVMRTHSESVDHVMGGSDKLSKKILQAAERYPAGIIFLARSNVVIVAGHDATPVLRDLEKKIGIPMVSVPDSHVERDYVTGYLDALSGLLAALPTRGRRGAPERVTVAGYLFDRNEGDNHGNVAELKRMLKGIGARPGPVMLEGTAFQKLRRQGPPGSVVDIGGDWEGGRRYAERVGARHFSDSLPVGLQGTADWLNRVGKFLGREKRAKAFVEAELADIAPALGWMLPRFFAGKSVLVFADRLLLGPLVGFLEELSMVVAGAGCTSVGTGPEARAAAGLDGYRTVPVQVPALREFVAGMRDKGELDLVVGNSIIHQLVRPLGVPCLELGYPSNFHHRLHPAPTLGFAGVRVLVERLVNLMEQPPCEGDPSCA